MNGKTKISVDTRLTEISDNGISIGTTRVGNYTRDDYAKLQKWDIDTDQWESRQPVYYRNSVAEGSPNPDINPGLRALYSLQLSNNTHVMKALIDPLFDIGQLVEVNGEQIDRTHLWNLIYNRGLDKNPDHTGYETVGARGDDVIPSQTAPNDVVINPTMFAIGDAISLNDDNSKYSHYDAGQIETNDPIHPNNQE